MSLVLDGEATTEQANALHAHLRVCADCAATWARWRAIDARFREAPLMAPLPRLAERVLVRLEARRRRHFWSGWLGAGLLMAGLAAICIMLIACGGVWWGLTHPLQASIVLSAGTRLLSSMLWPVRSASVALTSVGVSLGAGAIVYLCVTAGLLVLWGWLVARRSPLSGARIIAGA